MPEELLFILNDDNNGAPFSHPLDIGEAIPISSDNEGGVVMSMLVWGKGEIRVME